ncbi:MAG: hypothetical protein JWO68_1395 [Actinomycetia bacterium]|nr:hypothetical protein [Actinomycetes bacterium]
MRRFLRDEGLVAALPAWLLARVAVALGFMTALVATDELRPGHRTIQLTQGLLAWDAAFYRDIADGGYHHVAREGLRFFPLLPLAARALGTPLLGHVGLALLVIVQVAALVAAVLLYRLAVLETGDRPTARRATWLLALLPPATVLVLGYAEAILLVFAIGFFLAVRQGRWWTAAALGVLAGLSRPVGMTLALPALIEAARLARLAPWRGWVARAAAIAGPVVGGLTYLLWVGHVYGDWRLPLRLQNSPDLRGGYTSPLSTIWHAVRSLDGGALGEGLHLPWIAVFAVLLVVAFRTLPVSYGAWSAVLLLSALTGHTLGSFERYGLAAFPLVLALAIVVRRPLVERSLVIACGAGLTAFAALTFVGAFVP